MVKMAILDALAHYKHILIDNIVSCVSIRGGICNVESILEIEFRCSVLKRKRHTVLNIYILLSFTICSRTTCTQTHTQHSHTHTHIQCELSKEHELYAK